MDEQRQVDIDFDPIEHQPMHRVQRTWVLILVGISWLGIGIALIVERSPWLALFPLFCSAVAVWRLVQDWRSKTIMQEPHPKHSRYQP